MLIDSRPFRLLLTVLVFAVFPGCDDSNEHRLSRTVEDDRPAFIFNRELPFRIELGRGSGLHGLDTIAIDESGNVEMQRRTPTAWKSATFTLTPAALRAIVDSLERDKILALNREYHADVHDGTQWVFRATQGTNAKTIYLNNYFPARIKSFASDLDAQIDIANRELTWSPLSLDTGRDREEMLWAGIRSR